MAKTKRNKKRKSQDSTPKKSKCTNKKNPDSGIDKSQKLLQSIQKPRKCGRGKLSLDKRQALNLLSGKPMPPLTELEQMYEDSDEDKPEMTPVHNAVDSNTPEKNSTSASNVAITLSHAKKYANEILKVLDSLEAPQPIIPMRKYKNPEIPYIVGCTERPRIPEKPNCNIFKGEDYGITSKTNAFSEAEDQEKTPGFYLNGYSLSKSSFNAQANEIASKLLSNDYNLVVTDSDSDDTVVYELLSPKSRFSPEPSTSKDSETISKNDQKFIESFESHKKIYNGKDTVIENGQFIIDLDRNENLCNNKEVQFNPEHCPQIKDTLVELATNNARVMLSSREYDDDIEIIEVPCKTNEKNHDVEHSGGAKTNSCPYNKQDNFEYKNTNIVEILDEECKGTDSNADMKSLNKIIEFHNPVDLNIIDKIDLTNIDIDDVISENQRLIDKYSKHNTLSFVNLVDVIDDRPPIDKKNTNRNKNTTNIQFGKKTSQNNNIQMTNSQNLPNINHISNELKNITEEFFNKDGNTHYDQAPKTLMSHERIFPNCFLNNNVNSPVQNKNNWQTRSKKNNKTPNKISTCCTSNNNYEATRQSFLGTCPICLDDLSKEKVGSTNCGHLFCMPCITTALKTKPKRCPTCRKKLTGSGYHQIFM